MAKKYGILRIVAFVWKVVAWVILVISVLSGCGCLAVGVLMGEQLASRAREFGVIITGSSALGAVSGVLILVSGILTFIPIYASAEMIDVLIALEENTRATAEQLKGIAKA